jgi:hypothetical protein
METNTVLTASIADSAIVNRDWYCKSARLDGRSL